MKGVLYFDGSSHPKLKTPAAAGWILYVDEVEQGEEDTFPVDPALPQTNNVAEYSGLIGGLEFALKAGIKELHVIGDSQLVIYQVQGKYRCKNEFLKPLLVKAHQLSRRFDKITYEWKRREHNKADAVSRME